MTEHQDNNAILLQVMAHDLLAPLTAVKWQTELLEKSFKDKEKREKYLKGLAESTELGIALSKHAHVAGKVLSHSYEGDTEQAKLSRTIQHAALDLRLQYERHALSLTVAIPEEGEEQPVDVALTKLYVWSVAKFFLSCCLPQTEVRMKGEYGTDETSGQKYILTVSAENVPNPEECVKSILTQEDGGNLNQMAVFSKLLNEVASVLHVTIQAKAEGGVFSIISSF